MRVPGDRPRFWSEADCKDLLQRLERVTTGGGTTSIQVWSTWVGYVRWARNLVTVAGEMRNNMVRVERNINSARSGWLYINDVSSKGLEAAARHAERAALANTENPADAQGWVTPLEPLTGQAFFSEATYQLGAEPRTRLAQRLAAVAAGQGLLSAGYVQVVARSNAILDTLGRVRYVPYTQAQYSVTVRDPKGTGSGWAGQDHWDWAKLDPDHLTQVALEKCVKSQNPVRVEPGRYTAILEPQATADLVSGCLVSWQTPLRGDQIDSLLGRFTNEVNGGPFTKSPPIGGRPGFARLGERVVDPRLSLSTDPTDSELGYPPFFEDAAFHPMTWIKDGVLQALSHSRAYAVANFRRATGLPNPGGFRMSVTGPTSTIDDMVASTKRGLLVSRFDQVQLLHVVSTLSRGYTRDGLWLIEDGKISKPVKNFQFTETVLGKLNSVEQVGQPVRAFHPMAVDIGGFPQPVIVPALKVTDFSFTALSDAV